GRSDSGAASIDQLGAALKAVLDAVTPGDAQVVLVGHSMGGMTIMALAQQHPELFGTKVVGSVLINTAARGLDSGSPWMPAPVRPLLSKALPGVLAGAAKGRRAILVERGRQLTDLAFLGSRVFGFGDGEISPAVISFVGEVVARFGQALLLCDKRDSLATIGRAPATVIVAEKDRLISSRLGIELAMDIPGSHLIWAPGAGHALILERPSLVNDAITGMLAQVGAGGPLPPAARPAARGPPARAPRGTGQRGGR